MAKKVDPRDFLINTDYETDKLVWIYDGMIQIDGNAQQSATGKTQTILIPHGLPFYPLVFGICSHSKDLKNAWSIPYASDFYTISANPVRTSAKISLSVYTNKSNVEVSYFVHDSITNPQPFYFRLYGLQSTTSNTKAAPTKSQARVFLLNSDHNYRKIYKKDHAKAGETVVINHNLGYIPQCQFWIDYGGINEGYIGEITDGITITKNTVSFTVPSGGLLDDCTVYYRIYCDEA